MASQNYGVGYKYPDQPVAYNQRDLLLYAAGVGATIEEPLISYELTPGWAPLTSYLTCLAFKGTSPDVVNFDDFKKRQRGAPGLPDTSKGVGVHAEQSVELFRPLPHSLSPSDGWVLRIQLTGVADSGKGLRTESTSTLVDKNGTEYARMVSMGYTAGDFKMDKFSKFVTPKPPAEGLSKPPDRAADKVIQETPPKTASIIYRLSGDYNPLHIDPEIGKKMFGGTINHGLHAYGVAGRHLVKACADGHPERLVYQKAKFASVVKPGDALETRIWLGDKLSDGRQVVYFVQINQTTAKPALAGGVALIAPAKTQSKL